MYYYVQPRCSLYSKAQCIIMYSLDAVCIAQWPVTIIKLKTWKHDGHMKVRVMKDIYIYIVMREKIRRVAMCYNDHASWT